MVRNIKSSSDVYIIQLNPGTDDHAKWYVGQSENTESRFQTHKSGDDWVAKWTDRNKVVSLESVVSLHPGNYDSSYEFKQAVMRTENSITLRLMRKYGRETTRGGKWTRPELSRTPELTTGNLPDLPEEVGKQLEDTKFENLLSDERG